MTTVPILLGEAGDGERRAAGLDRLAAELERESAALAGRLEVVLRAFTDAVWRGPAAGRARDELLGSQRRIRAASDELRGVAALLRRRADDARAQSLDLRRRAGPLSASALKA